MTDQPPDCRSCGTPLPTGAPACPRCGAPVGDAFASAAEADLAVVRTALAEDYDVQGELGRGGMAVVYRARERRLDREVAIKVLPLTRSMDQAFVERFQREARTAAALEHPNIIPIHRVGESGRVIYFAMKFVSGPSLASVLRERHTLPVTEIRRMLAEVGSALAYAARRGVVHRDIKPDNILRDDESGRFLVTDFGIAHSADTSRLTEPGMAVGTPRYMSPEQASGQPLDGRSDIYSLGVVAYECLTGRPPFDEGDSLAILFAHVHTPVPRPAAPGDDARALVPIVERMLAKDPTRRYQTGDELARAASDHTPSAASIAPTEKLDTVAPAGGGSAILGQAAARAGAIARRSGAAALRHGARVASEAPPRIARGLARLRAHPLVRWATATRRRALGSIVVAVVLLWGGKTALHFATKHRSRCPTETAGTFSVWLDPVGTIAPTRDLDVYYDVCGLGEGTPYAVRVQLSHRAGGIRGVFGGRSSPVVLSYDETAKGPATRRHRTIDLPELDAGAYAIELNVTTGDGRSETRHHDFQFLER